MSELEQERHGHVTVLRLNRPEASNALTPTLLSAIGRGLIDADADPDVRVVVITGTGERAFCGGMDLKGFAAGGPRVDDDPEGTTAYMRLNRGGTIKPVVGAANGTAVGGGFELLLGCDCVVASSSARFGLPEVRRGLLPMGGGMQLARRIPAAIAAELALTGEPISAERAASLGLVNRVVPPEDVMTEALALAERIAANAPLAVQVAKRIVKTGLTEPATDLWALQQEIGSPVMASADAAEGARAFIEKRDPVWTGR